MTTSIAAENLWLRKRAARENRFRCRGCRDDSGAEATVIASRYFNHSTHVKVKAHSSRATSEVFHNLK